MVNRFIRNKSTWFDYLIVANHLIALELVVVALLVE
jgi:hypothetical protein